MNKTELKKNITKINKLIRSDSWEAGIELIKTFNNPDINKGSAKAIISRIKKLLKDGDIGASYGGINGYNVSVQIAKEMNEPKIYEEILKGCSIDTETGEIKISNNKIFDGNRRTRQKLAIALLDFIAFAPKETKIDKSIKLENIKILNLSIVGYWSFRYNPIMFQYLPQALNYFTNLQVLDVGRRFPSLKNLDNLKNCKKLQELNLSGCTTLNNIDELKNCKKLQKLNLSGCTTLNNIDELENCKELQKLDLSECTSLQNIDALKNCKELKELYLSRSSSLQNIDGLKNCKELQKLDLSECTSLQNIDGLKNCKELQKLDLSKCTSLQNIDGVSNCTKLIELSSYECTSLQSLSSLKNCKNLQKLDLSGSISINEVQGLENCTALTKLNLCNKYYHSLYGVIGRSNVAAQDYSPIKKLNIPPSHSIMTSKDQIKEYQEKISIINALNNKDKKKLSKYKNKKNIDLKSSSGLYNIDELIIFEELEYLDLSKCPNIVPKPSPVTMTNNEQIKSYQIKIAKKIGIEIPNSLKVSSSSTKKGNNKKSILPPAKTIRKIKSLLKKRDYDTINTGIELARSLENPLVFETLLKGCSLDKNGKFIRNKIFSGTKPALEYLDYAFLSLIGFAPKGTNIDESIDVHNITSLRLSPFTIDARNWINLPDSMANFKKLKTLDISSWTIKDISALSNLSNLIDLKLGCDCERLDDLEGLKKIKSLDLTNSRNLSNIDSISKLTTLTNLKLPYLSKNKLLPESMGKLNQLEELILVNWKELSNVNALKNCVNLKTIRFKGYILGDDLSALPEGLNKIPNLNTMYIELKELKNVDSLYNLENLTSLYLEDCDNLQNIDGLGSLSNLKSLKLWSCDNLQNVNGLVDLNNLTSLDLRICKLIHPQPSKGIMTTRKEVSAYQEEIKKTIES